MIESLSSPAVGNLPVQLAAIKRQQQRTWATGDFSRLASHIHFTAEQLVQAADLQAGWKVLDVATGSGNAALAAARLGCETVGVDYVPALLRRGRTRARAEMLDIDFREGDAENLAFEDGSFDAVVSIFGAMFAPRHQRAADELLRVLRPGGRLALACWNPDGFIGEMFRAVARYMPPPKGLAPPTLWGRREYLESLFSDAVVDIEVHRRLFSFRNRSKSEFIDIFCTYFGPTIKAFEAVGEKGARALEKDLRNLLTCWNRNQGGGPIAIPGSYIEFIATKG